MVDDTVVGALISAAASVVAAAISKTKPDAPRELQPARSRSERPVRPWLVTGAVLTAWFLLSPALLHGDLAEANFFVVTVAAFLLAWIRPIKPPVAASVTLALFAFNWIAGPMRSTLATGSSYSSRFPNHGHLSFVLALGLISALGVSLVNFWRGKKKFVSVLASNPPHTEQIRSFVTQLERVGNLRGQGVLSDQEFS